MNKHRFRIVFNQLRGLMMVVAENVNSHKATTESGKASSVESLSTTSFTKDFSGSMRPIAFCRMCALGLVTIVPNPSNINLAHAEAKAANNVPGNQRSTVLRKK